MPQNSESFRDKLRNLKGPDLSGAGQWAQDKFGPVIDKVKRHPTTTTTTLVAAASPWLADQSLDWVTATERTVTAPASVLLGKFISEKLLALKKGYQRDRLSEGLFRLQIQADLVIILDQVREYADEIFLGGLGKVDFGSVEVALMTLSDELLEVIAKHKFNSEVVHWYQARALISFAPLLTTLALAPGYMSEGKNFTLGWMALASLTNVWGVWASAPDAEAFLTKSSRSYIVGLAKSYHNKHKNADDAVEEAHMNKKPVDILENKLEEIIDTQKVWVQIKKSIRKIQDPDDLYSTVQEIAEKSGNETVLKELKEIWRKATLHTLFTSGPKLLMQKRFADYMSLLKGEVSFEGHAPTPPRTPEPRPTLRPTAAPTRPAAPTWAGSVRPGTPPISTREVQPVRPPKPTALPIPAGSQEAQAATARIAAAATPALAPLVEGNGHSKQSLLTNLEKLVEKVDKSLDPTDFVTQEDMDEFKDLAQALTEADVFTDQEGVQTMFKLVKTIIPMAISDDRSKDDELADTSIFEIATADDTIMSQVFAKLYETLSDTQITILLEKMEYESDVTEIKAIANSIKEYKAGEITAAELCQAVQLWTEDSEDSDDAEDESEDDDEDDDK